MRRLLGLVLATALVLAACGSEESREGGTVSEEVEEQLAYLEPDSALVVAVDMRYEEENWESLRGIADRVLAETREVVDDRAGVPADAGEVLDRAFADFEIGFSADPRATRAHAVMPLAD